ncbi:MAG: hypothetical protein K0M45_06225 [Candidatus Paracaedibacteraceae bacterium]|nr:hypothetical protein [Candidatus Paracaedibacteraceae bacterium]
MENLQGYFYKLLFFYNSPLPHKIYKKITYKNINTFTTRKYSRFGRGLFKAIIPIKAGLSKIPQYALIPFIDRRIQENEYARRKDTNRRN